MKQTQLTLPEIKLVGIDVRTSNVQEVGKTNGKIGPCVQRYFHEALFEKIPNRAHPGVTYCAYTEYESDYLGAYTYLIGEAVTSLDKPLPNGFRSLIIPEQHYTKFTVGPGPLPDVIVNAWVQITALSPQMLGGTRAYKTDFELYDERAADHQRVIFDLYVGIV